MRVGRLLLVALAAFVLSWITSSLLDPTGTLVRLTWTVPVGLLALAAAMVAAGWPVRRWTRSLPARRARAGGAGGAGRVVPAQGGAALPAGAAAGAPAGLRRLDPLRATRVLALARASAVAGAAMAGAYAALAALTAPTATVEPRVERLVLALLAVLAAAALAAAGVVVERWCRVPPDDDQAV
jgi:MFS family permease